MGQGSGAQGTSRGFDQLKKGHEAVRVTLPLRELLIPRSERELRRSEGSGTLIDDPLVEGSNAGSTNKASDLSQSSGGRRNSDAQKGAACS